MSGEFEDLLRDSMSWFAAQVQVSPGLVSRAAQRHRRRRLAARAAVAAGAAVISAAAVIVVTTSTSGVQPAPRRPGAAPAVPAQATAYVLRRAEKAVNTQRLISEVSTPQQVIVTPRRGKPPLTSFIPRELVWIHKGAGERDEVFGAYLRQHGQPGAANVDTGSGPVRWTKGNLSPYTQTVVNYSSRTWSRGTQLTGRADSSYSGTACHLIRSLVDPQVAGVFFRSPSFIASVLACGGFSMTGPVLVDGTAAMKLTSTARLTRLPMTVYISPTTFLLIRTVLGGLRQDYRWLAPTPANRALLTVPIPAGFRRVTDASGPSGVIR